MNKDENQICNHVLAGFTSARLKYVDNMIKFVFSTITPPAWWR